MGRDIQRLKAISAINGDRSIVYPIYDWRDDDVWLYIKENHLLKQSILTNGWTLPIVVRADYTIIDGFHRWTVAGQEPLKTKLGGKVPVVWQ